MLIFTDNHIHIPSSTVDPLSSHFILHGVSVSIPLSLCLFLKLFSCRDFFSVSALHKIHRPFVVRALLSSSVPVRHEIATVSQHEQHVSACTTTTWKYLQLKILLRFSIIFLCGFLFRSCFSCRVVYHTITSLESAFSFIKTSQQSWLPLCLLYLGFLFSLCWFLASSPPSVRRTSRAECQSIK